jgi:hypothetical protein
MIKYIKDRFLLFKFKKQDKDTDEEIALLMELWELLKKKEITKYDKLLNSCLYFSLINRDIYYLCEYFYFEKNKNRKNLFGRILSMTIIEFLEDINFLLGKELADELKKYKLDELLKDIRMLNKYYSQLKRTFNNEFRLLRNEASAHHSRDANILYKLHRNLGIENLTAIGYEIGKLGNRFVNISNNILEQVFDVNHKEKKVL